MAISPAPGSDPWNAPAPAPGTVRSPSGQTRVSGRPARRRSSSRPGLACPIQPFHRPPEMGRQQSRRLAEPDCISFFRHTLTSFFFVLGTSYERLSPFMPPSHLYSLFLSILYIFHRLAVIILSESPLAQFSPDMVPYGRTRFVIANHFTESRATCNVMRHEVQFAHKVRCLFCPKVSYS